MVRIGGGLLCLALFGLVACGGDDDDGEARTATFEPGPCPVEVPDGAVVECGELVVPERRDDPDGGDVRLAVATIRSTAEEPHPDPVLQIQGGPGFPSLENLESWTRSSILESRDLVLFDQRGVGFSEPNLDCVEVNEAVWELFRTTDPGDVEGERLLEPMLACRDRLVADGVDLAGYTTVETAADVADLRVALGIDEWNLRGVSYGSAVAMEVVRSHPEGVRSALLDSVVPPDAAFSGVDRGRSAQRAFDALYDACAADVACTDAYGDLEEVVARAAASLDAEPHPVTVEDPATGEGREANITGGDLYAGLFNALYDRSLIPAMPAAVQAIADGDRAIIDLLAADGIAFVIDQTEGMTLSVNCADRARLLDPGELDPFLDEHPELSTLVYLGPFELACPEWDVPASHEAFNELLTDTNDVPVLLMAGAFDPVTPPEGTQRVADALGLEMLLFPDAGHGAVGTECGRSIWFALMDDPEATLDTSCVDDHDPPAFG